MSKSRLCWETVGSSKSGFLQLGLFVMIAVFILFTCCWLYMTHKKSELCINYGKKALKKGFCIFNRGKKNSFFNDWQKHSTQNREADQSLKKEFFFQWVKLVLVLFWLLYRQRYTQNTAHRTEKTLDQVCFLTRAQRHFVFWHLLSDFVAFLALALGPLGPRAQAKNATNPRARASKKRTLRK